MRIHTIKEDELEYYSHLLPDEMQDYPRIPGMMAFGAAEEDEGDYVGAGILLISMLHKDEIRIEWLYVDPKYRGEAIASQLLYLAFDLAQADKRPYVSARVVGTGSREYHDDPIVMFLTERQFSFREFTANEWFLKPADAAKLVRTAFGNMYEEELVRPIKELSDRLQRNAFRFALNMQNPEFPIVPERIDRDLSCAFVDEDEVEGVLLFMRAGKLVLPVALVAKNNDRVILNYLLVCAAELSEKYVKLTERIDLRVGSPEGRKMAERILKTHPAVPSAILYAYVNAPEEDEKEHAAWLKHMEGLDEIEENRPKELTYVRTEFLSGVDAEGTEENKGGAE